MAKSLVRNFSQLSSNASCQPLASRYVASDLGGVVSRQPSWVGSMVSFPEDITEPALEPKQRPVTPRCVVVSVPDPTALYEAYSRESDHVRSAEPGQAQRHDSGRPPSISGSRGVLVAVWASAAPGVWWCMRACPLARGA
jgi:hypothetical protein